MYHMYSTCCPDLRAFAHSHISKPYILRHGWKALIVNALSLKPWLPDRSPRQLQVMPALALCVSGRLRGRRVFQLHA